MRRVLVFVIIGCAAGDETPAVPDPVLLAGRRFVHELKNDPASDGKLFAAAGFERAQAMLAAVMQQGQSRAATLDDWDDLHRALAGLIELHMEGKAWLKASLYATLQHTAYRSNDGDCVRALAAARQALDLVEKSGATESVFLNWTNIGQDLLCLNKVDEALDALHKARDRFTGPLSRNAAHLWRDIVQAEIARNNMPGARDEVGRFQAVAGPAPSYFRSQSGFAEADLLMASGQYAIVPAVVKAALAGITDADRESLGYEAVNELMTCVLASMNALSYPQAIALASEIDRLEGLPFRVSAFTRAAVRMRRRLAGDMGGVLREDAAALEGARKDGNLPLQIESLQSLAADYAASNSSTNQIAALEEALALQRTVLPADIGAAGYPAVSSIGRTLLSLGDAYARNGEPEKALRSFDETVKIVDAQTAAGAKAGLARQRAQAILGQAQARALLDEPDEARKILEQALQENGHGYDRADVLLRLARLDREDRPEAAPAHYREALSALRAARERNTEIAARLELAKFLVDKGNSKAAGEELAIVSSSAATANFADAAWRSAFLSGVMAESGGDLEGAIAQYRSAIEKVEAIRARFPGEEQRQGFTDNTAVDELYGRLIALLTRLARHDEAWQYVERSKARAFVETLQGRRFRESVPASALPEIASLEKKLVNLRTQLAPASVDILRAAGHHPAVVQADLDRVEARLALARDQAGLNATRESKAVSLSPASLTSLRATLAGSTVLVEYALLPNALSAFIVTKTSSQQILWKINKDLGAKAGLLRRALAHGSSAQELTALLAEVSEAVWNPVSAVLPANTKTLLIVPAAYLNYLPFQVLTDPGGGSLIDRYSISYLPSATTLTLLRGAPARKDDLFLGALGTVRVEGAPALPGTLSETSAIAGLYPQAQRVNERDFTHDAALRALEEHERVHLATHGLLDEHAPLFSALLVSPAPGQSTRVYLYELMDVRLKAKLVVLSACKTGLGKLLGGDEVAGLTRTILGAGANTVISSLWQVSDESTALLMEGFYQRLHAGMHAAEALRESALEVRKRFPHPFYWAPFVLTGVS